MSLPATVMSVENAKEYGFKKAWYVWFSNIRKGDMFFAIHKSQTVLGKLVKDVRKLWEKHKSDISDYKLVEELILLQNRYEKKYKVDFFLQRDMGYLWKWNETKTAILAKGKFGNYIAYRYKTLAILGDEAIVLR
ncbi:MAG: hypothetical protein QXG39_00130 [Candidatus Aenigmatarchaeota archaeon]